jgi:hypothetical protein
MGFDKYKPIFLQNEIDGEMLMQLLDEDLEEMVAALDPKPKPSILNPKP